MRSLKKETLGPATEGSPPTSLCFFNLLCCGQHSRCVPHSNPGHWLIVGSGTVLIAAALLSGLLSIQTELHHSLCQALILRQ
jgi:hypothetical protein